MKNKQNLRPIQNFLPGWIYSIEKRRYKMPTYTVTKTDVSSKGKPRVYFDNRHAWQDAYYVSPNIHSPQVGMTIEADTASQTFEGAKGATWFLNGFKVIKAQCEPATHLYTSPDEAVNLRAVEAVNDALRSQLKEKQKGWAIEPGDLSRFASNVVGSAIEAKLIEKPEDVEVWAAAAYRAAESLRTGKVLDFNDVVPDLSRPDPVEPQSYDEEDPGYDPSDAVPF